MAFPYVLEISDSLSGTFWEPEEIFTYKPGQTVCFAIRVKVQGVLTDAPGGELSFEISQAGATPVAQATPTHDGTGLYHVNVELLPTVAPGAWWGRAVLTDGSVPTIGEKPFYVANPVF